MSELLPGVFSDDTEGIPGSQSFQVARCAYIEAQNPWWVPFVLLKRNRTDNGKTVRGERQCPQCVSEKFLPIPEIFIITYYIFTTTSCKRFGSFIFLFFLVGVKILGLRKVTRLVDSYKRRSEKRWILTPRLPRKPTQYRTVYKSIQ